MFVSINEKATKYLLKGATKTLGGPGWVRYTVIILNTLSFKTKEVTY